MLGIQHSLHRPLDKPLIVLDVGGGGALQHFHIPNKMIMLAKAMMDDMVAKVPVETEMTELFEIRRGQHHCRSICNGICGEGSGQRWHSG